MPRPASGHPRRGGVNIHSRCIARPNSLDGKNALVFCDSTSGALIGDDDTGWVPATPDMFKCEVGVAKIAAKLNALARKCHGAMDKAFFKGADYRIFPCNLGP